MGYVNPPEPSDDVVIWEATGEQPAFTWGDHRKMEAMLKELEETDPTVMAARQRLDDALAFYQSKVDRICEFCRHTESSQSHDPECPDNNDPSLWAQREAGGYQYLDDGFKVVHTTSVPMTDDEALEYFGIVQLMFPADPDLVVKYITRREIHGTKYQMMPYVFDKDAWEVTEIERPGS